MSRLRGALALLAALSAGGAAPAARADLVVVQRERGPSERGDRDATSEKEIAIARDKMRIRDLASGHVVIVRLDRRVVWEIPPGAAEYVEIPFEYLARMKDYRRMTEEEILEAQIGLAEPGERGRLRRALDDARRRRERETPETRTLRDSLDAERGRIASARPEVRWTGRTETIARFASREAELTVEGRKVAEVWVADAPAFGDELAAYDEAMRSLALGGGGGATEIAALGGFPMRTILYPIGKPDGAPLLLEVVEVRREALASWEFDVPPGLERAPFLPPEMER